MTILEQLEKLRQSKERVRLWFGDTKTGVVWDEENDVMGYISMSTGIRPIYLLVHNTRSIGGCGISVDNILRIKTIKGRRTIWNHPNCLPIKYLIRKGPKHEVFNALTGVSVAEFTEWSKAEAFRKFMMGEQFKKTVM